MVKIIFKVCFLFKAAFILIVYILVYILIYTFDIYKQLSSYINLGSRKIAPTLKPNLTFTQTLTLTKRQFSSGTIVRIPLICILRNNTFFYCTMTIYIHLYFSNQIGVDLKSINQEFLLFLK